MKYKDKNLQALLNAFNSDPVDALGSAKQQLDLAKKEYNDKRQVLLDQKTFGKYQGQLYEATISEVKDSTRIDTVALVNDLIKNGKISKHYIEKHTKTYSSTPRVNIKFIGGK